MGFSFAFNHSQQSWWLKYFDVNSVTNCLLLTGNRNWVSRVLPNLLRKLIHVPLRIRKSIHSEMFLGNRWKLYDGKVLFWIWMRYTNLHNEMNRIHDLPSRNDRLPFHWWLELFYQNDRYWHVTHFLARLNFSLLPKAQSCCLEEIRYDSFVLIFFEYRI